jgi:N4-gp56 family major capsid protein
MANSVSVDALRQELWGKELFDDVARDVKNILKFVGTDENNIVQVSRELGKKGGDVQTFGLMTQLTGNGVTGDDELEGNEEAALTFEEQVAIDQIRNAVRTKGKLDMQKVSYDMIKEYREKVRLWMKQFLIRQVFLKAGGVTNTTLVDTNGVVYSSNALWSNTPNFIPDADEAAGVGARYICADTAGTDALTAGTDIMTLDLVTKAATIAKLATPGIQPLEIDGDEFYVMFLHPLQARDIKLSTDWKSAQKDAQIRGDKNPIFKGALGFWSNVLLLESEYVPWLDISVSGNSFRGAATGTDCTADAARALLFGKQAVLMAECSNPDALTVETFDYGNKTGVAGSFIGGVQKAVFNSKEFGVIAVDTAAAV